MQNSHFRIKTDASVENVLNYAIVKASDQKLLPRFIWDFGKQNKTEKLFKQYRKQVGITYNQNLKHPLIYNPQEAKSHRQKFRQKVLKLLNHDLQIDYLTPKVRQSKKFMTYKEHQLQQIKYETKKEYQIFKNFNQESFKHGYDHIFDDKLQYHQKGLISEQRRRILTEEKAEKQFQLKYFSTANKTKTKKFKTEENNTTATKSKRLRTNPISLPTLVRQGKMVTSKNISGLKPIQSSRLLTQRFKFGKVISGPQDQQILKRMQQIGGYGSSLAKDQILLTKQSIIKYLKSSYERFHRIVDFLQFSPVQSFDSYSRKMCNLKLMPKKHIEFMTFLFYDNNNDGYICQADMLRVQQNLKKNPLLDKDLQMIRRYGQKYQLCQIPTYIQLYKRSQVSQTVFFNWSKTTHLADPDAKAQMQLKNYMLNQKKRSVFIDFKGFSTIFRKQKPVFWYDLIHKLSGLTYEGLSYE